MVNVTHRRCAEVSTVERQNECVSDAHVYLSTLFALRFGKQKERQRNTEHEFHFLKQLSRTPRLLVDMSLVQVGIAEVL